MQCALSRFGTRTGIFRDSYGLIDVGGRPVKVISPLALSGDRREPKESL